jgi:tetratricopeptide (TPR) repeat protein
VNPTLALALALALAPQRAPAAGRGASAEAELLAAEAARLLPQDAAAALAAARRALALTAEFVPTDYVSAGRKGEVVEDEFQAARDAYRRHRAGLYEAAGAALARQGMALAASRYLRRAFLLDPTPDRGLALARAQNDLGRGREALDTVQRAIGGLTGLKPEAAEVIARAADVAGLPSAQAEIDRGRLAAMLGKAVELREGPLEMPAGARLSTSPVFRLEDAALTVLYASEASCRTCSADLEEIARQVPKDVRVLAVPPGDDQDAALRQVLALYRRPWPLLLGRDLAARLGLRPRTALLVARGGWTLAVLKAPFGPELGTALAALQRVDVKETVPRAAWNRRPVDRSPIPPPPGLLPEGLSPGEDEPAPPEFEAAVAAFRAGRAAEAQKGMDALEARGDGWLLPPEARLNRALCLARAGQRDAARRILLRTGDSRFEDEIDRLLESVAAGAGARP